MIEFATVARPYAKALFELAQEKHHTNRWLEGLNWLSEIVSLPEMTDFISQPDTDANEKANELIKLLDGVDAAKDELFQNFLHVVATEKRLEVLPEIFVQYQDLVLAKNQTKQATIYSAYEIKNDGQRAKIISDLEQHFQAALQVTFVTEPELIGGIKVVVGDKILDLSVQAKLQQLYTTLTN